MESPDRFDGKAALVTGASTGIGRAAAIALAERGARVSLLARTESDLRRVADGIEDEYGVDTVVAPADVTNADEVRGAVDATVDEFGRLDVLVNSAAGGSVGFDERVEEPPVEEYGDVIESTLTGTVNVTHVALPHVRETKGNVIFIGSSAGRLPRPGAPIYAAAKWGVRGFALSLEAHAGQDGVAVSLINTTAVRTERWDHLDPGQAAEPEELGRAVVYAASQAPHTTVSEINLHRRDLLGKFVPSEIDLDLAFDAGGADR